MRRTSTAGEKTARLSSGPGPGLERLEAGVDEAGFGPLLGPLCLGYAALERRGEEELGRALRDAVAHPGAGRARDLPEVGDSKVLHSGPAGFARLERTALLFLALARGRRPASLRELLEGPFAPPRGALEAHPWYRDLEVPLPRRVPPEVLDADLRRTAEAAARAGVRVREAGVRVVPEAQFNEGVRRLGNKATFHLGLVAEVLRHLATLERRGEGTILVDRLGGRRFYAGPLASLLPDFLPTPLREGKRRSDLLLHGEAGGARLAFCVGGERLSFACALASVLAKYARELLVERLNEHFARRAPGLRATAGYFEDGRRFLADLRERLRPEEVPMDLLVRIR